MRENYLAKREKTRRVRETTERRIVEAEGGEKVRGRDRERRELRV